MEKITIIDCDINGDGNDYLSIGQANSEFMTAELVNCGLTNMIYISHEDAIKLRDFLNDYINK